MVVDPATAVTLVIDIENDIFAVRVIASETLRSTLSREGKLSYDTELGFTEVVPELPEPVDCEQAASPMGNRVSAIGRTYLRKTSRITDASPVHVQ
jgi:hypothetical protein